MCVRKHALEREGEGGRDVQVKVVEVLLDLISNPSLDGLEVVLEALELLVHLIELELFALVELGFKETLRRMKGCTHSLGDDMNEEGHE
jgi:hypothetical protein